MTHSNGHARLPGCKQLVLTRRPGEGITLTSRESGRLIAHISYARGNANQCRFFVEAPDEVVIVRDELLIDTPAAEGS